MIIKIEPSPDGGHCNQSMALKKIPEGWAVIPDDMETPNFPFGEVIAEEIDGVMTITSWVAGTIPKTEPEVETEPTTEELINIIMGVNE